MNWDNIGLQAPVSTGQHPIRMVPQLTILHTARVGWYGAGKRREKWSNNESKLPYRSALAVMMLSGM